MRGQGVTKLALLAGFIAAVALMTAGSAWAVPFHGLGVGKGCVDPTAVFQPYTCSYVIRNNIDTDTPPDTYTITKVDDVVHANSGDVDSGNILGSLPLVSSGGATCSGGTGSGTGGDPYLGSTLCTLPFGSSLEADNFSFYTVQPSDFNNTGHLLADDVTVTWQDIVCANSCPVGDHTNGSGSSTHVTQLPSNTATTIKDAGGNPVTTVVAGTTVHDSVSVTGDPQHPPTGNVRVDFFDNSSCSGPPADTTDPTNPTLSGGAIASVLPEGPLAVGSYGYEAHYLGDGAYTPSDGTCEPLSVVDANINITPATATDAVGDDHVLTITVNALGGTIDAGSHTATASIVSGPGSFVGSPSCTYTGGAATASCTVTITSAVVGTTVVQATSNIPVSGLSISRTTGTAANTASGGSGNASKNWVDANINITPASATNPLDTNHVLTITVNALGGNIDAGPHTATASIVSGPGSFVGSPTCTYTGGGPTASCTVTITSSVVGTTVVQATSNIPVSGVVIPRTTGTAANTASGGSGNASKSWVDANIQISPASATDEVGDNHVLTITVNALGGTIDAGSHTATASIVSGPGSFVGSPSCTYTGGAATASCTVTITSATPGTTVVQATSDIPVGGVVITRTTGTAQNTASGGSGNASKTWVDANIQISPGTATNPVGTNHVLTCHINVNPGTGFVNAPDGTTCTVTIISGPGTPASQNCTTSGGTGSCTATITSATAGTTTVSASTTVSVGGVSLTRTTNGTAGNSGPATKLWADDLVTTKVLDASNTDVTGSTTILPGTVVHDQATVAKTAGTPASVPAPTGTVTFTLFNGTGCSGTTVSTGDTEPLVAGVANSATFTTPAAGGPFSYLAHYDGDSNYPAHNAGCEPFTVSNPAGPALTPGFWKNHQAATTALLPILLGNYDVDTFGKALAVFNAMKCSSPIDCLAGHLLAAKLDLKKPNPSSPSIIPTIMQADALLIAVNYGGPGVNTANAAQNAQALALEVIIDAYTNA